MSTENSRLGVASGGARVLKVKKSKIEFSGCSFYRRFRKCHFKVITILVSVEPYLALMCMCHQSAEKQPQPL